MPVKVRIVVDHVIDCDESSITPEEVKASVFQAHPTISTGTVKVNGREASSHQPLQEHEREIFGSGPVPIRELELIIPSHSSFDLKLKLQDGSIVELSADWCWTFRRLKHEVEEELDVPVRSQRLSIGYHELGNHEVLANKMASSNALVTLGSHNDRKADIVVKTLMGKTMPFQVSVSDTVLDLKTMIYEKEGIPPNMLRIVCNRQVCVNDNTLGFYNIGTIRTLHCTTSP